MAEVFQLRHLHRKTRPTSILLIQRAAIRAWQFFASDRTSIARLADRLALVRTASRQFGVHNSADNKRNYRQGSEN